MSNTSAAPAVLSAALKTEFPVSATDTLSMLEMGINLANVAATNARLLLVDLYPDVSFPFERVCTKRVKTSTIKRLKRDLRGVPVRPVQDRTTEYTADGTLSVGQFECSQLNFNTTTSGTFSGTVSASAPKPVGADDG